METHFEGKMYFYGKHLKQRKTELLKILLPEKFRNFRKITEMFPSTKVIETQLLYLTKYLTL